MSRDEEIRRALAELIQSAVPAAKVKHWMFFPTANPKQWGAAWKSESDAGRVNAWFLFSKGNQPQNTEMLFEPSQLDEGLSFEIWGFLAFASGDAGNNSTDEFDQICEDVRDAVNRVPQLGLETVQGHGGLAIRKTLADGYGDQMLHWAVGSLVVQTYFNYEV